MTRAQQILSLANAGLETGEIAQKVGCRPEYVRVARRRARLTKPVSQAETLQQRIEALYRQGLGDAAIAERLDCSTPYVRVARQRAGLYRVHRSVTKSPRAEAKLIKRIDRLQDQLTAAWHELRRWRDDQGAR